MQRSFFVRLAMLCRARKSILPSVSWDAKSNKVSTSGWMVIALTLGCLLASGLQAGAAQQVLKHHVPAATKGLKAIRRMEPGSRMDLAIGLPLRNREALTNLLEELYRPAGTNFRHFLTADEFASSFGPSKEDYQSVIDFAKAHNLSVKRTHSNRTLLDVSGSVADVEKAFHVNMQVYQHPKEKRMFYAPDVEPSLDLATPVLAISGLDNYVTVRPQLRLNRAALSKVRTLGGGGSGGGGGGGNSGPYEGYDLRNAYAAGVTQDGAGQSIGLFELFGYSAQDIQDFEDEAGIYPYISVQPVLIDGASGDDSSVDWVDNLGYLDYSFEVTGDIEMAISMAPGLNSVLVYEGPTPMDVPPLETNYVQDATTTAQVNDVLNRMATDDQAQQLSCSYGFDINLSTEQIFQQYAAQGQSFFTASGDGGAFSGAIDEPADDPNITVVGGTSLATTASGAWASETVWLTPPDGLGDPLEASGGGVSTVHAIPSWQEGISMTANQGSTTMRNVPDVAMVANNLNIVWGNDFIGASSDFPEGGTSLATPLWAGLAALVNQQAAANGQPPIGFINPALYAIGKSTNYSLCFHDITSGNNFTPSSPSKYSATVGYDLCTGWGSPVGSNLMQALLSPPVEELALTPPVGFTSFGPGGGPFDGNSQTFTLSNTGPSTLNWNLVNTSSWVSVSATSGSLKAGGGVATVTVSLNATAKSFLIGSYSGNVSFVNSSDGTTQNRQFDLYVGNGGFETGDFTDWTLVGDPNLVFALSGDDSDVAGTNALSGAADAQFVHAGLYGAYLGEYGWNGDPPQGTLSQTVATIPGQQYKVSFWLTSVESGGTTSPNDFAALWDGSILFAQTNLSAFDWTNMQFVVPATSHSSKLEFQFNNVPAAFGLDDVSVEAASLAPIFQSVTLAGDMLNLTWSAATNFSYQLQSTSDLSNTNWTSVPGAITVTNGVATVSEPVVSPTQQFYRVVQLPTQ